MAAPTGILRCGVMENCVPSAFQARHYIHSHWELTLCLPMSPNKMIEGTSASDRPEAELGDHER